MEQQVELAAHRLQQLPAHGRGKGLEGSDVEGHGGEDCNGGMSQQALALGRCRNAGVARHPFGPLFPLPLQDNPQTAT